MIVALGAQLAQRGDGQQPDRAGADHRHPLARLRVGDRARRAARRRAARPARRPRRAGRRGRRAAGSRARPGPRSSRRRRRGSSRSAGRRETCAVDRVPAQRGQAAGALGAVRLDPARLAAERRLHDDALALARAGGDLADDLVAGHERRRRSATARYSDASPDSSAWSEPQMPLSRGRTGSQSGAGRRGRADVLQRERPAGRRRARLGRPGSAAIDGRYWSASIRPPPFRRAIPRPASRRRRASRDRRKSGLTACGWPTISSSGRSARLSP